MSGFVCMHEQNGRKLELCDMLLKLLYTCKNKMAESKLCDMFL